MLTSVKVLGITCPIQLEEIKYSCVNNLKLYFVSFNTVKLTHALPIIQEIVKYLHNLGNGSLKNCIEIAQLEFTWNPLRLQESSTTLAPPQIKRSPRLIL